MKFIRLRDVQGEFFKTGRHTRVLIGANSPVQAESFVTGVVVIKPDGNVPLHQHLQEEVYYILDGTGEMIVEEDIKIIDSTAAIYIPSNAKHSLKNIGKKDLTMLFIYSPSGVVSHWAEESST